MFTKKQSLILLALFTGGFVPIHAIVLSFGYAQYYKAQSLGPKVLRVAHEFGGPYALFIYIPSLIILSWIILYSKKHYPDLFRRITFGLLAGAIATIGLDWIRQMGVINGWLPGDNPPMFGKVLTGSQNFIIYHTVGQLAHFLNGADFGLCFALFFGNFNSYLKTMLAGIGWLLVMEFFMMIGPPMVPMTGPFGVRFLWPQMFLLTFVAHVVCGAVLGLLIHLWLKKEDSHWLLPYLKNIH